MSSSQLVARGSVKDIHQLSDTELEFVFSDRISVFDKPIPVEIPRKGEVLARISAFWFDVAGSLGIHTHFLGMTSPRSMQVRRVAVIRDYSRITKQTRGYLIPIEFVSRYYVAGMLYDRVRAGQFDVVDLGFSAGYLPRYGEKLPRPLCETGTKLEPVDVFIPAIDAMAMGALSEAQLRQIWSVVARLDQEIETVLGRKGKLIHPDGKKEFAIDIDGGLMLVDTFGTPDEDRFWDAEAYATGECVELSKEFVRQYYRKIGYHGRLMDARKTGQSEPNIPPLPDNVLKQVSDLYISLFERLTGETFR